MASAAATVCSSAAAAKSEVLAWPRRGRQPGGAGGAAARRRALAEIDGNADALVTVVLESVDRALAHRHRQALALGHVALAGARAETARVREHLRGKFPQLIVRVGEAAVFLHGALS
jgi:hypothetical protein